MQSSFVSHFCRCPCRCLVFPKRRPQMQRLKRRRCQWGLLWAKAGCRAAAHQLVGGNFPENFYTSCCRWFPTVAAGFPACMFLAAAVNKRRELGGGSSGMRYSGGDGDSRKGEAIMEGSSNSMLDNCVGQGLCRGLGRGAAAALPTVPHAQAATATHHQTDCPGRRNLPPPHRAHCLRQHQNLGDSAVLGCCGCGGGRPAGPAP